MAKQRFTSEEIIQTRAQSILMTSIAIIAGMLPIAVGLPSAGAFRVPMAICVIGGIITSTLLTLIVVPTEFTVVDDVEAWPALRFTRVVTRMTQGNLHVRALTSLERQ